MFKQLNHLKKYNPTNSDKIKSREEINNAAKFQKNRDSDIKTFENGVFPFSHGFQKEMPDMSDKALPDWVIMDKKRFNTIKKSI